LAPWADAVYAMDRDWWDVYGAEVSATCVGARVTVASGVRGVERIQWDLSKNSGAGAIMLAAHWGARSIFLLGYDVQRTNGRAHWHGDHPKGLGNAGSLEHWTDHFNDVAARLRKTRIINCSRQTALSSFPRRSLESCLTE